MSVLGTHPYQRTGWHCCERLCLASVNFFEDSFRVFAHFKMVIYECTCLHHAEYSAVVDQKQHDPHAHPPYSPDVVPSDFLLLLFPWMKTGLKGKCFADVQEVKQKTAEVQRPQN